MERQEMDSIDKKFQKELNAGISALVLLSVLSRADGPMYGYQIARLIEDNLAGGSTIKLGTLYPVLRSLEDSSLLSSEVEPSITGPPRRYYRITEAGRDSLERWKKTWRQTKQFIDTHLEGGSRDQNS